MPYRIRGDPYRPPQEGVIVNMDKAKGPQRLKELSKELSPLEMHDPKQAAVKHLPVWSWPAAGVWTNFNPTANRLLEESFIDGERVCRIWDNSAGGGVMLREFDLDNKLVMPGFKELRREFHSEFPPHVEPPEVIRPKYSGGPIKPSQCFKWRVGKTTPMRKFAATPPAVTDQKDRFSAMADWAGLTPEPPPPPSAFIRGPGDSQSSWGALGNMDSPKSVLSRGGREAERQSSPKSDRVSSRRKK